MPAADEPPAVVYPIRRQDGAIVVELSDLARQFVLSTAERVRRSVEDPASAGYGRLYARIDESTTTDDPLVTLERQTAIDDVCRAVAGTAGEARLSDGDAEAWLKMLGMAVALTSATAGIRTDEDLEMAGNDLSQLLDLLRSLQVWLAFSLDPSIEDLDDFEGRWSG
ncbi:MAG: hypothetical protein ACRDYZ_06130 [Acidimicrobiales bacterium]